MKKKKLLKSPSDNLNKGFIVQSNNKWIAETNFNSRVTEKQQIIFFPPNFLPTKKICF